MQVTRPDDERVSKSLRPDAYVGANSGDRGDNRLREEAGVGYRVISRAQRVSLRSVQPPGQVTAPEGITFNVEAPTRFSVLGIDKQQVGEVAANIRRSASLSRLGKGCK